MNSSIARIYSKHYGFDLGFLESVQNVDNEFVLFQNERSMPIEAIERLVSEIVGIKIKIIGEMVWV